ncbi:hypothetical protein UFOVP958_37 [uncultured Caudovirales phage]|uniref:Uncharacterized protein n=1 Tax=uncultured Caudovirales phage TaxID=2100421 RepID=A0A6J5N712_9CAUD|nr:hypothetical protein UFOVP644_41 [uncultured Caudovirales phage]CAB4174258.1 hypothetical protein UFOVP958_37 [uncultured Caudovirales phage]CAB4192190.1 hypothetical protein UFOVP1232_7 [uncultured Caudovirales phage]CAB5230430.1 hypothetical protein UFOVP1572_6 [uncultured Caudovirales phage]
MKLKDLASALGVTAQRVSILIKDGMPDSSVEAARAWREEKQAARRQGAPKPKVVEIDDGSLADTIDEHRGLVGRARGVWEAAMEMGDPNQGKYQTAYNQSLRSLINLEEEQERRALLARDYIKASDAQEAMLRIVGEVVARLDKMPAEIGEACNPNDPPKAIEALQAWVRKTREDLSK